MQAPRLETHCECGKKLQRLNAEFCNDCELDESNWKFCYSMAAIVLILILLIAFLSLC